MAVEKASFYPQEAEPPYSDIQSRRTVYSQMEIPASKSRGSKSLPEDIDDVFDPNAAYTPHTYEWIRQREKMREKTAEAKKEAEDKAGHTVSVPAELFVVDVLEGKSPFEILGAPEGDMLEAHKGYRRLMRTLHPDVVNAQIKEIVDAALGGSENAWKQLSLWANREQIADEGKQAKAPKILEEKELLALSPEDQALYAQKHQDWEEKLAAETPNAEPRIFAIRDELLKRAAEKAILINHAWEQIKKGLSYESIVGVSSLWDTYETTYGDYLSPHQKISLEGDAELTRELDFTVTDTGELVLQNAQAAHLHFAMGVDKEYGIYQGYREDIPIKSLFAFLELQDGRRVKPELLSDIAEEYALSVFDVGRLQDLLSERAEPSRIAKELGIVPLVTLPESGGRYMSPEELVQEILDQESVSDESFIRFFAAGYTKEAIDLVREFIVRERPFQAVKCNQFLNVLSYQAAKRGDGTFLDRRSWYLNQRDAGDELREINDHIHRAFRKTQSRPAQFERNIYDVLNGPSYTFSDDTDAPKFRAGVEFGRDGLRIIIPDQDFRDLILSKTKEVFFNVKDLGVMREIAYGRSLPAKGDGKFLAREQ